MSLFGTFCYKATAFLLPMTLQTSLCSHPIQVGQNDSHFAGKPDSPRTEAQHGHMPAFRRRVLQLKAHTKGQGSGDTAIGSYAPACS